MNLPPNRYHTKAKTELERKKERDYSFIFNSLEIHKILYKKNYEKVGFLSLQLSYLLKEVKSIHLTNLYNLCE